MKFRVKRASDCFDDEQKEIELNSLEELIKFVNDTRCSVIVHYFTFPTNKPILLEIYDDWRE